MLPAQAIRWTVLIYANGNNELDAELFHQLRLLDNLTLPSTISVVIQIARASDSLLAIAGYPLAPARWSGVRRFILTKKLEQVSDLGTIIMANPHNLAEFINWGTTHYPADRTMLILAGHSTCYTGTMLEFDASTNKLSLMSIPGMCQALSAGTATPKIDILILDTCFMDMIEIWYEFALTTGHPAFMLVPQPQASRPGLPWHQLIRFLEETIVKKAALTNIPEQLSTSLAQNWPSPSSLLAVDLTSENFLLLKQEINSLAVKATEMSCAFADRFLTADDSFIDLIKLEERVLSSLAPVPRPIHDILRKIVICPLPRQLEAKLAGPLLFAEGTSSGVFECYKRLRFADNNTWLNLLAACFPRP